MRIAIVAIVLGIAFAEGKQWTTENLAVDVSGSYCYGDSDQNCRRYGRLYTWEAAQRGCHTLGVGWRLPTDEEWRALSNKYGDGKAAYAALLTGGSSGFNAPLGGNRGEDGQYARLEAHGFFWTSSEADSGHAVFYNFGKGSQALFRQPEGNKQMAISVRCVKE